MPFARVVDTEHMGMRQPRGDVNLTEKALGARGGDVRIQHFHRYLTIVAQIAAELSDRYHTDVSDVTADVTEYLSRLAERELIQ